VIVTDREQFEAHIKTAAWYRVLSEAAKEDDESASVFRMARMAASEAWQASRRAALDEAAKLVSPGRPRPCDCDVCDCGNAGDMRAVAWWDESALNANAIRSLATGDKA
jgi:hypothetical protein